MPFWKRIGFAFVFIVPALMPLAAWLGARLQEQVERTIGLAVVIVGMGRLEVVPFEFLGDGDGALQPAEHDVPFQEESRGGGRSRGLALAEVPRRSILAKGYAVAPGGLPGA